jgi:small-conductance mechanosensitive channel
MKAFIGVIIVLLLYGLVFVISAKAYQKMRNFPEIAKFLIFLPLLLVVIAVVGILAAIIMPFLSQLLDSLLRG